jgi:hypothetical protein
MEYGKNKGRHEALVEVQTFRNSWHKEWGYVPVEIYSKMVSIQDAYELGQRSAKRAHQSPMRFKRDDLPFIQGGLDDSHTWRLQGGPPWLQAGLVAAWCHGFNSVPVPDAAVWNQQHTEKLAKLPWNVNK